MYAGPDATGLDGGFPESAVVWAYNKTLWNGRTLDVLACAQLDLFCFMAEIGVVVVVVRRGRTVNLHRRCRHELDEYADDAADGDDHGRVRGHESAPAVLASVQIASHDGVYERTGLLLLLYCVLVSSELVVSDLAQCVH